MPTTSAAFPTASATSTSGSRTSRRLAKNSRARRTRWRRRPSRRRPPSSRARRRPPVASWPPPHSPPIPLEMTFNIFRTTKGQVMGQAVHAEVKARRTSRRPGEVVTRLFPVREYYTNRIEVPAATAGGQRRQGGRRGPLPQPAAVPRHGRERPVHPPEPGPASRLNYLKGLSGVWLQAMVLTAIGVWAGTFLSWPVALLMTIFFFVAGQVAFGFLRSSRSWGLLMVGGGPFESLIRLLGHENMHEQPAGDARRPDGQDARRPGHADHGPPRLHRAELRRDGRQQHRGRRVRRRLAAAASTTCWAPLPTPCPSPSPGISS